MSNTKEGLISIIIPVYNVELYLERCVKSVINQTYENIEIILVDDGSTDSSGNLCDMLSKDDDRINVIHKKNGGLSDARNVGLSNSRGEYIGFVDSDDWIEVTMYERLLNALLSNLSDIAVCERFITTEKDIIPEVCTGTYTTVTSHDALKILIKDEKYKSHAWNKLYKREILLNNLFPVNKTYEDIYIMHNIFLSAKKITFLDIPLYYYFQRESSIVNEKSGKNYLSALNALKSRYNDLNNYPEYNTILKESIAKSITYAYKGAHEVKDRYEVNQQLKKIIKEYNLLNTAFESKKLQIQIWCIMLGVLRIVENFSKASMIKFIMNRLKKISNSTPNYINDNDKGKKIVLMGGPEYNNLGDSAIAYATQKFCEDNFPNYRFIEISEEVVYNQIRKIKKDITNEDILLLQGGGNLGNVYMDQQKIREKVIKSFPHNKIIQMPQTPYFSNNEKGKVALSKATRIFSKHKQLILLAREEFAYEFMKDNFQNRVLLVPDIVLYLRESKENIERKGIGICLRNDIEADSSLDERTELVYSIRKYTNEISFMDTISPINVTYEMRKEILKNKLDEFSKKKLIITDRLHGVIFAAITKTPCIALSNSNRKVEGICKWFDFPKDALLFAKYDQNINESIEMLYNKPCSFKFYESNEEFKSLFNEF